MMTLEMPTLLALLGTALMAVAIFAPPRAVARATVASAPAPDLLERWHRAAPMRDEPDGIWPPQATFTPPEERELAEERAFADEPRTPDVPIPVPTWHLLVDPRAAACDAAARWELVDALAAVRAPWSEAILIRALDDESDPDVRNAVRAALAA